jgi:chromate reductase
MTTSGRPGGDVLLVHGSLRRESFSTRLLHFAGRLLPDPYVAREIDAVRSLPWYDADLDVAGSAAGGEARKMIAGCAGLLISTPEYNGTIPGGLKNWYDWVTRPYREHVLVGKPVGVIGASTGARGATAAVTWLRDTMARAGAVVVGDVLAVADVANQFDENGLPFPEVASRLGELVAALVTRMQVAS